MEVGASMLYAFDTSDDVSLISIEANPVIGVTIRTDRC